MIVNCIKLFFDPANAFSQRKMQVACPPGAELRYRCPEAPSPSPLALQPLLFEFGAVQKRALFIFFWIPKVQKRANLVDLEKCYKMRLCSLS